MTTALKRSASLMFYALYLLFPNYPSYYFPCYMLILYNHITLLKKTYRVIPVPYKLLSLFAAQSKVENNDLNNSIVINKHLLDECGFNQYVLLVDSTRKLNRRLRIVRVIPGDISKNEVLISDVLNFNLKQCGFNTSWCNIKAVNLSKVSYFSEVDVSVVNNKWDLSSLSVIELCLKNYFQVPKIVYPGDIIYVNAKKFASQQYYCSTKLNEAEFVAFKCNKVDGNAVSSSEERINFTVFGETAIKQSSNVQSYLPSVSYSCISSKFHSSHYERCLEHVFPSGLLDNYVQLEQAVKPFLNQGCPRLWPAFLLDGTDTSVMTLVVNALAKKLGLHVFEILSHDINANVYSHTETKLRNSFFKAKLSAPCIVAMHHFEYFEGQHDQRLTAVFETELEKLFDTNTFPVILICMGNSKETEMTISRCFLETFQFGVPNEGDRVELLKWILSHKKLQNFVDIDEVVGQTNGFVYEDLNSLVYYAQQSALISDCNAVDLLSLQETDFEKALEIMQAQYGETINTPRIPKVNWSDVGGLTEVKHEIIKTINLPMKHFEFMKRSGLKRSGILLYGPPGTGKTLIAKAVATECSSCFLSVKGPELLNMYIGQSEKNIREVFEKARAVAPCIIFFDELDSLAPNRGVSGDSGGVMDRVVSQLLAEMDGVNNDNLVFIIGATNRPDLIDPSLLRPGRFDKLLYVAPCKGHDSKLSVMLAQTTRFQFDSDVNLDEVTDLCPDNITGADFYGICSNAWMSAARRLIGKIENGDIEEPDHLSHKDVKVGMNDFTHAAKNANLSVKQYDLEYFKVLQEQMTGKM